MISKRRHNYLFIDMKIIDNPLDESQYFKEKQFKNQIVIHHTAGGGNAVNVIHGWNFNPEKVGTAYVIDSLGNIYKAFDSQYWAYHLGLKTNTNLSLNKGSIGIEVCNWGQLIFKDGKYWNYVNKEVPASEVVKIPKFRGFEYYHKYSDVQLTALKSLILELAKIHSIDLTYHENMWDVCADAMSGKNGLYTHVSYRSDKNDMNPQPNLITMLKSLK